MIIQKLRQKRDDLLDELREDGIPIKVLEKCCQHPSLYVNGYYDDDDYDMVKPFGWESFQRACMEVQNVEITEYESALVR